MARRVKNREVEVAEVSIVNLATDLERVAQYFCNKYGIVPIDMAVRERLNIPRGKAMIYPDRENWGRLILVHRTEDYEAVHAMIRKADMRLKDVEENPEAHEGAIQ